MFKKKMKEKKKRTIPVDGRKRIVIALWILFISAFTFAIYKNFTAIDIHTIYQETVIQKQLTDTSGIQTFVKRFATEFYSWGQSQEAINERNERLENYLTEELQRLNFNMIRNDIPTTSAVTNVHIWEVIELDEHHIEVIFEVDQRVTEQIVEIIEEDEETHEEIHESIQNIQSVYRVLVHKEISGEMVITKQTVATRPQRSDFERELLENNGTVDATTMNEVTEFLEMFFTLYPEMTEQQLAFYVQDEALKAIENDYLFVQLLHPTFNRKDDVILVQFSVEYLCNETKTTRISQFELRLEKINQNWKILGGF